MYLRAVGRRFTQMNAYFLVMNSKRCTESQIVDTMVFPILSYNSEVWGMYTKQDFKKWDSSPIEKIHVKFCKGYLEVNNKASNIACRAELDRLPLLIPINNNTYIAPISILLFSSALKNENI